MCPTPNHEPANQPGIIRALYEELKRRGVLRVGGLYVVAAWAAIQASDLLYQPLGFAHSPVRIILVVALIGFPIALAGAWFFNLTREREDAASTLTGTQARIATIASIAVCTLILVFGGWLALRPAGSEKKADVRPSTLQPDHVAILYFRNRDSTQSNESWLSEAITETLIAQLAQQDSITVISSNGVRQYDNTAVPPDSIAKSLNVGTIVSGEVWTADDSVHVRVNVIDPDGKLRESDVIAKPRGKAVALVDNIVVDVSNTLRQRIGEKLEEDRWRRETQNDSAWVLVQRSHSLEKEAHELLDQSAFRPAYNALNDADSLAAMAERLDPEYSHATIQRVWLAFGRAFAMFPPPVHDAQKMRRAFNEGYAHATRALERHPDDPQALEARGALTALEVMFFDPQGAERQRMEASEERDLRTASLKDPGRARALSNLSNLYSSRGDFVQAQIYARQAYTADAYLEDANILYRLFSISFELGQDADANKYCTEQVRRDATDGPATFCTLLQLAWSPLAKPDVPAAWRVVNRFSAAHAPMSTYYRPQFEMLAAGVIARAGLADSARAVIRHAMSAGPADPVILQEEAAVHVLLHENDKAKDLLERYLRVQPEQRGLMEKSRRFALLN